MITRSGLSLLGVSLVASALLYTGSHASAPAGGVTVSGVVKLQGTPPEPKTISMSKDPDCAKLHRGGVESDEVVVGPGNTLGNVIVYISEGLNANSFDPPGSEAVIDQKGCMYNPHIVVMRAGQKLKIVNSDPTTHNIHPMPENNREWNKSQPPGLLLEETFPREEIAIPVKCNVHPWMKSYIAVFKHPFYAVTDSTGKFTLPALPPGNYTVEAWHEKYGSSSQKIAVAPGETKTLAFSFNAHRTY